MSFQHKELAAGRWVLLSFVEQMANIGSEVSRFITWKNKNHILNSTAAFERALELMDLTIADARNRSRLRELARLREAFVDFGSGHNQYASTDASWMNYFTCFAYAARRNM
jgi:hypothetical protein